MFSTGELVRIARAPRRSGQGQATFRVHVIGGGSLLTRAYGFRSTYYVHRLEGIITQHARQGDIVRIERWPRERRYTVMCYRRDSETQWVLAAGGPPVADAWRSHPVELLRNIRTRAQHSDVTMVDGLPCTVNLRWSWINAASYQRRTAELTREAAYRAQNSRTADTELAQHRATTPDPKTPEQWEKLLRAAFPQIRSVGVEETMPVRRRAGQRSREAAAPSAPVLNIKFHPMMCRYTFGREGHSRAMDTVMLMEMSVSPSGVIVKAWGHPHDGCWGSFESSIVSARAAGDVVAAVSTVIAWGQAWGSGSINVPVDLAVNEVIHRFNEHPEDFRFLWTGDGLRPLMASIPGCFALRPLWGAPSLIPHGQIVVALRGFAYGYQTDSENSGPLEIERRAAGQLANMAAGSYAQPDWERLCMACSMPMYQCPRGEFRWWPQNIPTPGIPATAPNPVRVGGVDRFR